MKQFSYIIKDEIGLHARPAGLLAKEAKKYQSTVTLSCNGKSAAAWRSAGLFRGGNEGTSAAGQRSSTEIGPTD